MTANDENTLRDAPAAPPQTAPAPPVLAPGAAATDETAPQELDALEALAAMLVNEDLQAVGDPDPGTLATPAPEPEPQSAPGDGPAPQGHPEPEPGDPAPGASSSAATTDKIDRIELAALMAEEPSAAQTLPFAPVKPTSRTSAHAVERISGTAKGTGTLAWGSRTDVGRVRDHNEDSFVIRFPLFAVADGMGGHAAGEIASTLAVSSLAANAPSVPDSASLGQAVETANQAVIEGARNGLGRPGMGTTCTSVVVDGNVMAVGHVGDSRCYLLHAGQLVRVTHDHSYVEELVAAGEITPEEARIHPNRSIITRALGSDPNMKADHFTVEVARGDRVLLCSDGLSSMVTDDVIEEAMVSSVAPQACADALVGLALGAGGHDNVTCVVIDVKDDGISSRVIRQRLRNVALCLLVALVIAAITLLGLRDIAQKQWHLVEKNGYVALYRGIPGAPEALGLNSLVEVSAVQTSRLSDAVEERLATGISFESEAEARQVLDSYYAQLAEEDAGAAASSQKVTEGRAATGAAEAAPAPEGAPATTGTTAPPGEPAGTAPGAATQTAPNSAPETTEATPPANTGEGA